MNRETNEKLQIEEIEALESIFGKEWQCVDENDKVFNVIINDEHTIILQIVFTDCYPLDGPPIYRLNAPWLKGDMKQNLSNNLENIYSDNIGQSVVFMWIERIKDFLFKKEYLNEIQNDDESEASSLELNEEDYEKFLEENTLIENTNNDLQNDATTTEDTTIPDIIHGQTIIDRKSTFQAHLAVVKNRLEVNLVMEKLLENRKIQNATHNIMAYRICQIQGNTSTIISNCDDDGETGAGSRMLFLMKTLNVNNVLVVVSRWYGGIQLGPDRFKHINNCCRDILKENGFIDTKTKNSKKK